MLTVTNQHILLITKAQHNVETQAFTAKINLAKVKTVKLESLLINMHKHDILYKICPSVISINLINESARQFPAF